jgi:lysophospholipase L1-like esterase
MPRRLKRVRFEHCLVQRFHFTFRSAVFAIMGLLLLTAAGRAQTAAPSAESGAPAPGGILVKEGQKVVFMGDSITDGGWRSSGGFIHLVVTGLDTLGVKIDPIPAGMGGNKSDDMLARLNSDALSKKPDWLLLSCGVNDVWSRKIDLDTFKKNITSIVDQAQAAGIRVMIVTPTPIYEMAQTEFSRLSDYVAWMVQLAHDRKLPLADENAAYFAYLKTQPADPINKILTIDGVHPNPDGHQILAQTILEGFGVTPDQMAKVKEAWNALPDGANLPFGFGVHGETEITASQDAALEKIAADKKMTMNALVRGQFMTALRDAMVAHGSNLDGYDEETLSKDAQPLFKANISKLAPPDANAAAAPKAVAHTNEDGFTAAIQPNGNVKLTLVTGFRGTTAFSIPQYNKFKQIAIDRKLSKHALTLSIFMTGIRDTLVAHGDVSNVHQDNISHDCAPLYQKNVDDLVK